MATRYDAVLAAIPLVLVGGFLGEPLLSVLPAALPLSATLAQFPMIVASVVACGLIGHEIVRFPTGSHE